MGKEKGLPSGSSALRALAEERLRSKNIASGSSLPNVESQRLIHELQVHQIELEMQNEELRHARDERDKMEALLGRYSELYDFAPVGYFNLDQEGIISAVNLTGAGFLGIERSLLIGRRLDLFISDETRPGFHDFLNKVSASDTKETCEVVFLKKNHSSLFVQVEAVVTESREECRAVVVDITARKLAEEELRESERTQWLLAQIGEIGTRLLQSGEMIEAIGECVAKELGVSRCGFTHVDLVAGQVTVLKDYHSHLSSLAGVYPMNGYADYLEEGRAGQAAAFEDTATDPRTAGVYATNFAPIQVRAHLTVPLLRSGAWVANFWVSHHEPRHWTEAKVKAMTLIADRVWLAIERQRVDEDLRKSEERLRLLIDGARDYAILMLDIDGRVTSWNEGAKRLKGWDAEEILGRHFSVFYTEEAVAARHPEHELEIAAAEGRYEEEGWRVRKDGSKFMADVIITAIHNEAGKLCGFSKIIRDITERKRAEERTAHLASFPQLNPNPILEVDSSGRITFFNPATVKILETLGMDEADIADFIPSNMDGILESWDRLNEATFYCEVAIKEKVFGESIFLTPLFNVARIYAFDITGHKRAEEALQKAHDELAIQVEERTRELAEKEVLLKEVHHRVKNNLQVISSLVGLQADGSKDETVRGVLRDVTYRVRSMALVHEKLYQSSDLARIDFTEYTRGLMSYLWRAHGAAAANVRLTLDLEPVLLPVDTGVPCGLILNELAGNALKHAFLGRNEGEVTVSLHQTANGRICLRVRDNGVGLPQGLDWRQVPSLGLRLVQMLSGQIGANLEVSSGEGTRFEIVFGNKPEGG